MRNVLLALSCVAGLFVVGAAQAAADQSGNQAQFEKLDQNGDGRVSMGEYENYDFEENAMPPLFSDTDLDGDGYISEREWVLYESGEAEAGAREMGVFEDMDQDGDNLINKNEYQAYEYRYQPVGMQFSELDQDDDGLISEREWTVYATGAQVGERTDQDDEVEAGTERFGPSEGGQEGNLGIYDTTPGPDEIGSHELGIPEGREGGVIDAEPEDLREHESRQ